MKRRTDLLKLLSLAKMRHVTALFSVLLVMLAHGASASMPAKLKDGLIQFEVESGSYFHALTIMDNDYKSRNPVMHATALQGFHMDDEVALLLESLKGKDKQLVEEDFFRIGKIEYLSDRCVPALKAFKKLKNKLSLEQKQEWAFYRSNCFLKLGSNRRAAQALSDILSGLWISHAYYNLAMDYAETSSKKTKALVALRVAESLNAGKTKEEMELNDRINFAAGALYLEGGKPELALNFFRKVHLDSYSAAQALYLNGVAHHELNDFRAATQSWFSVKKYPLIHPGVAESYLAVPFAYERSGYIGQALEAYIDASKTFKIELDTIDKIKALIDKHGVRTVLIEENNLKGLEWFLAKDIATNTRRASYYNYLMRDDSFYDLVELFAEMTSLENVLVFWQDQLKVLDKSLSTKSSQFKKKSARFNSAKVQNKLKKFDSAITKLEAQLAKSGTNFNASVLVNDNEEVKARLKALKQKISRGAQLLSNQRKQSKALIKRIKALRSELSGLLQEIDSQLGVAVSEQLDTLRQKLLLHYEQSEQGLVHILEQVAMSSDPAHPKRRNRNGGTK